jgi:hypothetical protein
LIESLAAARRKLHFLRRCIWPVFLDESDADQDGVLTAAEIDQLCRDLRARPDLVLVTSNNEASPTSHPSCRERILLLKDAFPDMTL